MRLLECRLGGEFSLTEDLAANDIPPYAILSHRWGPYTEEVTFRDLVDGTGGHKVGYKKLRFCAQQARRDGLQYFWVDTCCIDKSNHTELHEAINSMFRWYQNATRCYVYLSDISASNHEENSHLSELAWEQAFRTSKWFTRGWTLQELLAPASVEFFTRSGQRLGDKQSLEQQIHDITGIAVPALRESTSLPEFDVEERFKWAETRQTTREEDWAYCLLGIFGVFMPLLYGEGKANAVRRLKKEIADTVNRYGAPNRQEAGNRTWIVPFERNPFFTGRESELKRLHQALFTGYQTTKIAITGLGGVGKTQLVLELVYWIRAEYKNCPVIWIPATNKESLGQAYLNAARQLNIPRCEDDKVDIRRLMQDYLSNESIGQWLLVFDNADDINMWVDKSALEFSRLIDYLPKSKYGSIIFTTRNKKIAIRLAGRNIMEMTEMDEAGSIQLLQKSLIDQDLLSSRGEAIALVARLTYLPLAIVQAAMFINANGISLGDYLSLLEEQEEDVIDLLSEDFEDEGRYHDIKNPVATTWLISFEQIRQRDSLAADYLSFMACIDARDIPQSLLPPGQSRKKEAEAIGTLQGYSFIAKRSTDSAINIHRLVHLAMRNWLWKEGSLAEWSSKVVTRLIEVLAGASYTNRVMWRSYLPHVYYILGSSLISKDDKDRVNLLWRYGMCLDYDGRYREAEVSFEQVMEIRKTKLGADHPDTLTSIANLASTYRKQGRWEEAEKLEVEIMEMRRSKLGADHPDTLTSMANLTSTYRKQGRWEEAEKLDLQVLEMRKMKLGEDHPDTLSSMNNLASTYWSQARWEEAEKLDVQVMEMRKTKLGEDHPDTLSSMNNVALTYWDQGRLEEAEKLGAHVMEIRKTKLGEDHPDTLNSMNNLSMTYSSQGRWEEAKKLNLKVMEIRKTKLGEDHPDTLSSMSNLSEIYGKLDQWEEAEKLNVQVVEMSKTKLGADHPNTLSSINNLALIYIGLGRLEEAEKLNVEVMEIRKTKLGEDHPDTLSSMNNLASTYKHQGRWEESEKLQLQVMEMCKTKLGVDHPNTLLCMDNLAHIWKGQGRHADALALMKDCAQAGQRVLGPKHSYTVSSLATVEQWEAGDVREQTGTNWEQTQVSQRAAPMPISGQ